MKLYYLVILVFMFASCEKAGENNKFVQFWKSTPEYRYIEVTNNFDVSVKPWPNDSLYFECTEQQAELLQVNEYRPGYILVELKHLLFPPVERPILQIYRPINLNFGFSLHQTAKFIQTDTLRFNKTAIYTINHSDTVNCAVNNKELLVEAFSGSSTINISGVTNKFTLLHSGMGLNNFANLQCDSAWLSIMGGGDTYIGKCNYLFIDMQFSGNVYMQQPPNRLERVGEGTGQIMVQ